LARVHAKLDDFECNTPPDRLLLWPCWTDPWPWDSNGLEFTGKPKFVIAGLARHDDEYGQLDGSASRKTGRETTKPRKCLASVKHLSRLWNVTGAAELREGFILGGCNRL
jgi:hypothetical protein